MPEVVTREQVQTLLEEGAQLVDVLPESEYEEQHISGAISLPLKDLDSKAVEILEKKRPIVTYCWDYQ